MKRSIYRLTAVSNSGKSVDYELMDVFVLQLGPSGGCASEIGVNIDPQ